MENNFSQILKSEMNTRNLKQEKLAALLKIRQSQISNWLNGKSLPTYPSIQNLCEKLNVSANKLFGMDN